MRVLNAIAHCHFISYLLLRDYNERDFTLTSLLHRSYIIIDLWVIIKLLFSTFFLKVKLLTFFFHGFVGYYTSKRQRETEEASS